MTLHHVLKMVAALH